ncbi:MAG: hypothetical protein ISP86_02240 [Shewanellaceae bacterium]|nr:hypothetical protein [Shewanellaceae bacterium]
MSYPYLSRTYLFMLCISILNGCQPGSNPNPQADLATAVYDDTTGNIDPENTEEQGGNDLAEAPSIETIAPQRLALGQTSDIEFRATSHALQANLTYQVRNSQPELGTVSIKNGQIQYSADKTIGTDTVTLVVTDTTKKVKQEQSFAVELYSNTKPTMRPIASQTMYTNRSLRIQLAGDAHNQQP